MVLSVVIPHGSGQGGQAAPTSSEKRRDAPLPGSSRLFPRAVKSGFTPSPEESAASARVPHPTSDGSVDRGSTSSGRIKAVEARSLDRKRDESAKADACSLLACSGVEDMQDFLAALILSECVYKKVELSQEGLATAVSSFASLFPEGWVQLGALQTSLDDIPQHYMIATGGDAMYVAFMGTKQARDLVADARFVHQPVWAEALALAADKKSVPAAHGGFLQRARAINIEQLHQLAASSGRRLVLCGHSLGGAVAKISTLRLLRDLPEWPAPRVKCICFATPAIGNAALADLVKSAGWASYFRTYFLPEDQVMRLASLAMSKQTKAKAPKPTAKSSWLAAAQAKFAQQDTPLSTTSTYEGADEAEIEEILSHASPVGDGPLYSDEEETSGSDSGPGAAAAVLTPAKGLNLGLAFALQRKRALRAVRRLARHVRMPLPPVRNFHTFGNHLFLRTDRAYSAEEWPSTPPAVLLARNGSEVPDLPSVVKDGPFSYHRMIAYRFRVLSLIAATLPPDRREELVARAVAAASSAAVASGAPPVPGAHPPPASSGASMLPAPVAASRELLSDSLYPRVSVEAALARMPIAMDCAESEEASDSPRGSSSRTSSSSSEDRQRSGRPWGGKATAEDQVALLLEVDGHNLQYVRTVQASLSAGPGPAAPLPTEVLKVLHEEQATLIGQPLTLLQSTWHQVAGSIGRYIGRQTGPSEEAVVVRTPAHMVVRVTVPKSTAKLLLAACTAADESQDSARRRIAGESAAAAGSSKPLLPRLTLHLKSDFQEARTEVLLRPYRAAVVGTSVHAATLLLAALSAPTAAGGQVSASTSTSTRARAAARRAMNGLHGTVSSWWGAPKPLRWAKQLMGWPGGVQAAYDALPPSCSAPSDLLPGAGRGASVATGRSLDRLLSDPGHIAPGVRLAASASSISMPGLAGAVSGGSLQEDGDRDELSSEGGAASAPPLPSASHSEEPIQTLLRQKQGQLALVLFPVTGLLLLARLISQAASKIVTVQVIGGYQAGAMAGAAQMLRRRPSSYAARVLQPAEMSGGGEGQRPATPLVRAVSWPSLPPQGSGSALGRSATEAGKKGTALGERHSTWKWLGRGEVSGQSIAATAAMTERTEAERVSAAGRSSQGVSAGDPNGFFVPQAVGLSAYNPSAPSSRSSSDGNLALASVYRSRSEPLASILRSRSESPLNIASASLSDSGQGQGPPPRLDKPCSPLPSPMPLRRSVSHHASLSSPRSSVMSKAVTALKPHPGPSPVRNAVAAGASPSRQRQAARQRQQQRGSRTAPPTASAVPASMPCLDGSLVVHNVLACVPAASPFVVLRALALALRRQAARQRRTWWGRMMSASLPEWQEQQQQRSTGQQGQLRPAAPLVHVYNFLRGIPLWLKQRRSHGVLTFDQDWKALLVAASALDPSRMLLGRDFARMVLRARSAGIMLVPVLLTSPSVPEAQQERALRALADACGVDADTGIRVVVLDDALLVAQRGGSAISAGLTEVLDVAGGSEVGARQQLVCSSPGAAVVRQQLQVLLWQQQRLQSGAVAAATSTSPLAA